MKRDMDLIRLILLQIEETHFDTALYGLEIEGYDNATIAYHCHLLHDAGYVFTYDELCAEDGTDDFAVGALTWAGHEYLERIRDNTRWGKIKRALCDKGLPVTIDMVKMIADAYIGIVADATVMGIHG